MKPSKHTATEPTGRMVNNHGHREHRYDDPAMNSPLPVVANAPRPHSLRSIGSTS